jgi:sugar lactone lactonase YvrE
VRTGVRKRRKERGAPVPRRIAWRLPASLAALAALALAAASPAAASFGFVAQWGGLGAGPGQLNAPFGAGLGQGGTIWIAERNNGRVSQFDLQGHFLQSIGGFAAPSGVDTDAAGNVYVADTDHNRVQKFSPSGALLATWPATNPYDVAVDSAGTVYASQHSVGIVGKWTSGGASLGSICCFSYPAGVDVDGNDNVFIVAAAGHTVYKYSRFGGFLTAFGGYGFGDGQLYYPYGIGIDGAGNVYVADPNNYRIQEWSNSGVWLRKFGTAGSGPGQFNLPYGVAADDSGNVYVADYGNHRVQKFGEVDAVAPTIDLVRPADGATYGRGDEVLASYSCQDPPGGSGLVSCSGTVADGAAIDTATLGDKSFTVRAEDGAGNVTERTVSYHVTDQTAPTIAIGSPQDGASYLLGSSVLASFSCADEDGGSGLATCTGDVADGAALDTGTVGAKAFTVHAADTAGNTATKSHAYSVVYDWTGFYAPINNLPIVNSLKAGQSVPVKFSLHGDQGLAIIAPDYPKSQAVACDSTAPVDGIETLASPGSSGLSYDAAEEQYTLVWKTDKAWANTCRQLVVRLADGTSHRAMFSLR